MVPSKKSLEICERMHELIPAGAHTYSKGDDQVPSNAPRVLSRGLGSHVWDVDGNEYVDWGMGLRSVILGYCYPEVSKAAHAAIDMGANFCRPHYLELELAEVLHKTIKSAEMVKFAKNGSDTTTAAVKLARAYTKRDKIAYCKDHPFFSIDDWFIGTTVVNAGVPAALSSLSLPFNYNNLESLKLLFENNPDGVAGVIMEASTGVPPKDDFLKKAIDLAHANGAVFIMDEIITGFRYHIGGAQEYFGVKPDLCTFGKAIANGFSVSVLAGKSEIMELGGIKHDKERVFLLSTTHGSEVHGLAAAKATIEELAAKKAIDKIWATGKQLKEGINRISKENGMERYIEVTGYDCSPVPAFRDEKGATDFKLKTYVMQEIFRQGGVLFPGYVAVSYSHSDADVQKTLSVFEVAIKKAKEAKDTGGFDKLIEGDVVKPVFRKYNKYP
ncbi:MAG: glutamate-1-semialdehyde 2,1-aminomutase [Candidatus Micrarchaeia archaeon]|jgi:glutamate-1-semialdehyde 2,1-aminomutase